MKKNSVALSQRITILLVVVITCVGCDQSTKYAAKRILEPGVTHTYLADTFRVVYAENSGAFLGLGASLPSHIRTAIFIVFGFCLLTGLTVYALRKRDLSIAELSALALLVGGGLGNIIDRVMNNGVVVDFLNIGIGTLRTGIFNVADMALMLGMVMLLFFGRASPSD